jgi:hypothetical protein
VTDEDGAVVYPSPQVAERALQTILDHYDPNMVLKKWSKEEIREMIERLGGAADDHVVQCTRNMCDAYHFEMADWQRVYAGRAELGEKVRVRGCSCFRVSHWQAIFYLHAACGGGVVRPEG